MSSGEQINIEGLVQDLKKEGVTKEDFDNLSDFANLKPEQIKQKIASFDEKEGLSNAEKKLYDILIKIDGIQILAQVTEKFKSIENINTKKIELSKEVDTKSKNIDRLQEEQISLQVKSQEIDTKAKEKEKETIDIVINVSKIEDKVKLIQIEIKELSEGKINKTNQEKINSLQNQLKILNTKLEETQVKAQENESATNKIKRENKKVKNSLLKTGDKLKKEKESLSKTTEDIAEITRQEAEVKGKVSEDTLKLNEKASTLDTKNKQLININTWTVDKVKDIGNTCSSNSSTCKGVTEYTQDVKNEAEKTQKEINNKLNIIKNTLNFGRQYENYSDKFYINNPKEIINITSEEKLINVLSNEKIKNCKKSFDELINNKFKSNIKIIKLFYKNIYKPQGKKFGIQDTKNINFSEIENTEEFLLMLHIHAIKNYVLNNAFTYTRDGLKDYILEEGIIDNKMKTIIMSFSDNSIIDVKIIGPQILEEDKNKTDNYLTQKGFGDNNNNNNNNIKNEILNLFKGNNIKNIGNYPKFLKKILMYQDTTKKIITEIPEFYNIFLPENKKRFFSEFYIDSILNNKNTQDKNLLISKVRLKNLKSTFKIFSKLNNNKNIYLTKILQYPEIRGTLISFMQNNIKEISSITDIETKKTIKKIQNIIGKYGEQNIKYKKIENIGNIEIDNNNNNNNNNNKDINLFSNKDNDLIKNIIEESGLDKKYDDDFNTYLSVQLIYLRDSKTNNGESDFYLDRLINLGLTDTEFKKIIQIRNKILLKENKDIKDKIGKEKIPEEDIKLLNSLNLIKDREFLDMDKVENNINKFIKQNKKIRNEKGEIVSINSIQGKLILQNLFIKKFKLEKLSEKSYLNILNQFNRNIKITQSIQEEKNTKIYFKALKTGNYTEYNKISEEGFYNQIDNEIKEYENKRLIETSKKESNNTISTQNYSFSPEIGTISLLENGVKSNITLTPTERLLINKYKPKNPNEENPILNNIVDFYKTLDRIGLSKLWTIKEDLFGAIQNAKGIGFKIDKDYLNENEIKIFLNSILKSVGEDEISPVFTLNNFISVIEQKNKTQIGGNEAIVNTYYGETYLENKLFSKFVPREGTIIGFNRTDFEKSILTNKTNNEQ